MNKKDNLEWTVHEPIVIKGEENQGFVVQCSECQKNLILPASPPDCDSCLKRIDLCQHGIACPDCSNRLMLEWIEENNMKAEGEQLKAIQETIKRLYNKEMVVNSEGYLVIKK